MIFIKMITLYIIVISILHLPKIILGKGDYTNKYD